MIFPRYMPSKRRFKDFLRTMEHGKTQCLPQQARKVKTEKLGCLSVSNCKLADIHSTCLRHYSPARWPHHFVTRGCLQDGTRGWRGAFACYGFCTKSTRPWRGEQHFSKLMKRQQVEQTFFSATEVQQREQTGQKRSALFACCSLSCSPICGNHYASLQTFTTYVVAATGRTAIPIPL